MAKEEEVHISLVKHYRACLDEKYEVAEMWLLRDLKYIDGKEAETVSSFNFAFLRSNKKNKKIKTVNRSFAYELYNDSHKYTNGCIF